MQCIHYDKNPFPQVTMYMAGVPDQPFPGQPVTWTWTQTPSQELLEIQKLREETRGLAKSVEGMRVLVERFLSPAPRRAKK